MTYLGETGEASAVLRSDIPTSIVESVLDELAGFRQKVLQMLATGVAANAR